jgi:hypothetical protein
MAMSFADWRPGIPHWFKAMGWGRRRIVLMLVLLGAAWVFTATLTYFLRDWLLGEFADDTFRGVFSAFTGELAFFSIVGAVITVIGLRDPMKEGFDERLRILYGSKQVPDAVAQYNKAQIARLSCYVKLAKRTINPMIQPYLLIR